MADEILVRQFTAKVSAAREQLLAHMAKCGLRPQDGWRISEELRQSAGKTELVLWPVHRLLEAPEDLRCVVAIDEPGEAIEMECTTP